MNDGPITCEVRYRVDPGRVAEFETYARIWIELIERYGGRHHGYFMPREKPADAKVSFAGAGEDSETALAVALFTFSDEKAYLNYREQVAKDPDGVAANARFGSDPPFISYERVFLTPLPRRG